MSKATDHSSSKFVKILFIGNSGAGKTGALASLAMAGYKLRIIDLDAGLDFLFNFLREKDPKALSQIEYESYRDKIKMTTSGPKVAGAPKAYFNTLSALEEWPEDKSDPAAWGTEHVLVIDSLTHLSRAAFQWAVAANPSSKDPRQWYKTAQDLVMDFLANVTSDAFETNVIVISHVDFGLDSSGLPKAFASSVGKAIGNKIPSFFNNFLLSETSGTGAKKTRKIKTASTMMLDLKNSAPFKIDAEYPMETGLADIFAKLRG